MTPLAARAPYPRRSHPPAARPRLVDRAGFEREALPWLADVARFARSLAGDGDDADDLVQETYLRAARSWHTFAPGDCRRWLFTICRNVFLRSRERHRRQIDIDSAERDETAAAQLRAAAIRNGLEHLFARIDLRQAIDVALGLLPALYRSAVTLVDVEGETYQDAAAILGVPIGTVRSRLFRGRRLLQERLVAHAVDAGLELEGARTGNGHVARSRA